MRSDIGGESEVELDGGVLLQVLVEAADPSAVPRFLNAQSPSRSDPVVGAGDIDVDCIDRPFIRTLKIRLAAR